jgi:hypothetical protein
MAADAGAQAPIWVPILVGGIGVVGVILTQVIASIRAAGERQAADRREDIRWNRAQDERHELVEREDRYRSHAERTEAYAKVVLEMTRWQDRLQRARVTRASGKTITSEMFKPVEEALHAAEEAAATLTLLAPNLVRLPWGAAFGGLLKVSRLMLADDLPISEIDDASTSANDLINKMLDAMRIDLTVRGTEATDSKA